MCESRTWENEDGDRNYGVAVHPIAQNENIPNEGLNEDVFSRHDEVCFWEHYPNLNDERNRFSSCHLQEFLDGQLHKEVINLVGEDIFNEVLEHVENCLSN